MGTMKIIIDDNVENKFRKAAMKRYGYKKGGLSEAAESALWKWATEQEAFSQELEEIGNPVEAISGMMSNVKKGSVELQQDLGKIWSKKSDKC